MNKKTMLEITVVPRSSQRKITTEDGKIRMYINSPPAEGRANEECVALLAKELGVAKSQVRIVRGAKGRKKVISVDGMSLNEAMGIIEK